MKIEDIIQNPSLLNDDDSITYLTQCPLYEIIKLTQKLDNEKLLLIFKNPIIYNMKLENFNSLFLQCSNEIQQIVLNDEKIFDMVMNIPNTRINKSILEMVSEQTLYCIINNPNSSKYFNKIDNFIRKLDDEKYCNIRNNTKLIEIYRENSVYKNLVELKEYLSKNFDISDNLFNSFIIKVKNNILNPMDLIRIKNKEELLIYIKFNLIVNITKENEKYLLEDGATLDSNFIENVSEKPINNLIKALSLKKTNNNSELLVAACNLYQIFGYDNALKIINDKFTYLTPSANNRICETRFRDLRREFRLKHQENFYHYNMEEESISAIDNNDINYFKNFCFSKADWYIKEFMDKIKMSKDKEEIKQIIITEINQRENYYKEEYIKEYYNKLLKKIDRTPLSVHEIYTLFKEVDIKFQLDSTGKIIINENLNKFLLGNFKNDNDCLLRIIINKEGLGLNDIIHNIINQFDMLESIVKKSKGKLSLNSILDIIDISKIKLYNLAPNEQDITLETLTKVIKSKIHCSEEESLIVKKACNLHVERKKKTYSNIPSISNTINDVQYSVMPFDADYAISLGIDVGNCFKVGGKGEDLLRYCLLNKNAIILMITDQNNNNYICPFVRSGNTIHGNGIDPEPDKQQLPFILNALEDFSKQIVQNSLIEIVTLTDLHISDEIQNYKYEKYQLKHKIPLDDNIYSDYHKSEIQNYIIYKKEENIESKYYQSDEKYHQQRSKNYQYSVDKEYDKERIQLLINSIAYSSIDFEITTEREKNKLKRRFKELDINEFKYIIGNKDWFIAIDSSLNIISYLLPYDERAKKEYLEAFRNIYDIDNHIIKEASHGTKR